MTPPTLIRVSKKSKKWLDKEQVRSTNEMGRPVSMAEIIEDLIEEKAKQKKHQNETHKRPI